MALGDGRRKTLDALNDTPTLQPIEAPDSLAELKATVTEVSVPEYMGPETEIMDRMDRIHGTLPENAQPKYVQDRVLLRRIYAMRRQFNTWKARKMRESEMPGPMEAGLANYPTGKLRKRQRSERNAYEELQEKKEKVRAAAKGARQRALKAIGSSVAEQNEKRRESKRETLRNDLDAGDYVLFTDLPNPDKRLGRVVRVNKKSARVAYATDHGRIEAGTEIRVELTPKYLEKVPTEEAQAILNGGEA